MPLYDTSIFVGHARGNPKTRDAVAKLRDRAWPVQISSMTIYELHFGCLLSDDPLHDQRRVARYLANVSDVLPVDTNRGTAGRGDPSGATAAQPDD